eukprot:1138884_1
MRSDRSVISFSIWTLPLQTMTKVPSCTGDQISDTTDDETNNLGCEGNVYPYECNYDDAALSVCSLVVKLAIQACNIKVMLRALLNRIHTTLMQNLYSVE